VNKISQSKTRFALIGCGTIANKHVTAINRINDAEIVGGYDINPEIGNTFKKKNSIPTFNTIDEMIDKPILMS